MAGGKAGKDSGKAKAKAVSRSARAGLQVGSLRFLWPFSARYYVDLFLTLVYNFNLEASSKMAFVLSLIRVAFPT